MRSSAFINSIHSAFFSYIVSTLSLWLQNTQKLLIAFYEIFLNPYGLHYASGSNLKPDLPTFASVKAISCRN